MYNLSVGYNEMNKYDPAFINEKLNKDHKRFQKHDKELDFSGKFL